MAIDASRVAEATHHIHLLWSGVSRLFKGVAFSLRIVPEGPFQLVITLALLYQQMQWSIIPGVVLLLVMIPTNSILQRIQKRLTVSV
jgi:hypothetical protein